MLSLGLRPAEARKASFFASILIKKELIVGGRRHLKSIFLCFVIKKELIIVGGGTESFFFRKYSD